MFDPSSPRTIGYHIFVEPEGDLREEMQQVINSLAHTYGGPAFVPHATLLARITASSETEVIDKSRVLARNIENFSLSLGEVCGESSFFRALYVKIANPEVLHGYHNSANQMFGLTDVNEYCPHLSLFYGNISDELRREMVEEVGTRLSGSFDVSKLCVYTTPGAADTWKKIAEVPFG